MVGSTAPGTSLITWSMPYAQGTDPRVACFLTWAPPVGRGLARHFVDNWLIVAPCPSSQLVVGVSR